jgi:hypothetical protein
MSKSIRIDRDVPMETRDGVTLRADVYRPDDDMKYPAILSRTPYNKLWSGHNDYLTATYAACAGYAFVLQDTRGTNASEGEFVSEWNCNTGQPEEGPDGYDAVEWVAAEPWCDGRVGMAGNSYLGHVQWQAALLQPPSLKAIAPAIIASGPGPESRANGVFEFEMMVSFYTMMSLGTVDRLRKEGRDVSRMSEMVTRAMSNIDEVLEYLPLKNVPHFDFDGLREDFSQRLMEPARAQLKSESDLYWDFEKVQVPCFHAGGWYDMYSGSLFTSFNMMRNNGGCPESRDGQHIFCGPWVHGSALLPVTGALNFGPSATGMMSAAEDRQLAFFDRYVKGMDVEIPAVRYFVMGLNEWRDADAWPLPDTIWKKYFLSSNGSANSAAGDGLLTPDAPGSQPPDCYHYNPLNPVPTVGGRSLGGKLTPGPFNQAKAEKRQDVLCYTTAPLDADLEVTGPIKVHLSAATSARDTDFVAKLVDVHPDGDAFNVVEGIIRARFRHGLLNPSLVTPGEVQDYVIDLASVSIVFRKGHRMRLDITSSNFPRFDRNMNTGNPFGEDAEGLIAEQTVFHDEGHASYVELPIMRTGTL